MIIGAVAAAVQVGGVAATFGGASAAAPKDPSVEVTHVMVIRSSSSGSGCGGATLLLHL